MNSMEEWEARCMAHHEAEVAAGLHDDECEYGRKLKLSILMLCHCSKRRRERAGFTTPPTDDLYFPPPSCPRCDRYLNHDGESWHCYECSLFWDSSGAAHTCQFTDDYGDLAGNNPPGEEGD